MDALPLNFSHLKVVLVVTGVALGVLDVKESKEKLEDALHERSARAIGAQMFIADPFFVAKAWRDQVNACGRSFWCFSPPPAPHLARSAVGTGDDATKALECMDQLARTLSSRLDTTPSVSHLAAPTSRDCVTVGIRAPDFGQALKPPPPPPNAWWRSMGLVNVARMAVFPVFQAGWTLFDRGWTARVVFLLSFLAALALAIPAAERADSLPGAVIGAVLCFLVVSIVLSFAFNLLLQAGNFVAGFWGVLVAVASGIYFTLELVGKVRELLHVTGIGGGGKH